MSNPKVFLRRLPSLNQTGPATSTRSSSKSSPKKPSPTPLLTSSRTRASPTKARKISTPEHDDNEDSDKDERCFLCDKVLSSDEGQFSSTKLYQEQERLFKALLCQERILEELTLSTQKREEFLRCELSCRSCLPKLKRVWSLQKEVEALKQEIKEVLEEAKEFLVRRFGSGGKAVKRKAVADPVEEEEIAEVILMKDEPFEFSDLELLQSENTASEVKTTTEDEATATISGLRGSSRRALRSRPSSSKEGVMNVNEIADEGGDEGEEADATYVPSGNEMSDNDDDDDELKKGEEDRQEDTNADAEKSAEIAENADKGRVTDAKANKKKRRKKRVTKTGQYTCEYCGKVYKHSSSLAEHKGRGHKTALKHVCSQCGRGFYRRMQLNSHMLTHTGEKPYVCSSCGKAFASKWYLQQHEKSVCGNDATAKKLFQEKRLAKYHAVVAKHAFKCPHKGCFAKFVNQERLDEHLKKIHVEGGRFPCPECGKPFDRKHLMETHIKRHHDPTGEALKVHQCEHCNMKFKRRETLRNHRMGRGKFKECTGFISPASSTDEESENGPDQHLEAPKIVNNFEKETIDAQCLTDVPMIEKEIEITAAS